MACSSTSCEELLREVKRAVEAVNEVKQAVAARNEEHQQQIALLNGEVKKAIATIVDDVKHALAAMKGHACDSERLIVDIKSLRGVAIITEKATDDVGLQLTNLNLRVNEDHQFFRDGWAAIQKKWRTMLLESRKKALDVAFSVKKFGTTISDALKNPDFTEAQKQAVLKDFLELWLTNMLIGNESNGSQNYTTRVTELANEVKTYNLKVQLTAQNISDIGPNQKINELKTKLEEIQGSVESFGDLHGKIFTVSLIGDYLFDKGSADKCGETLYLELEEYGKLVEG